MGDLQGSLIWGAKSGQYCVIGGGSLQSKHVIMVLIRGLRPLSNFLAFFSSSRMRYIANLDKWINLVAYSITIMVSWTKSINSLAFASYTTQRKNCLWNSSLKISQVMGCSDPKSNTRRSFFNCNHLFSSPVNLWVAYFTFCSIVQSIVSKSSPMSFSQFSGLKWSPLPLKLSELWLQKSFRLQPRPLAACLASQS
jgi:hypothetical protein